MERANPKFFEVTERRLEPNHTLQQKALAKQCAQWVSKDSVAVRSISRANFLHGKMYLTTSLGDAVGVVGSSNFTKRGLGGSDRPNLEISLATDDADSLAELHDWFDRLWGRCPSTSLGPISPAGAAPERFGTITARCGPLPSSPTTDPAKNLCRSPKPDRAH